MSELTEYISNDYKSIESKKSIAWVQDFFADVSFSHFPVTEEKVYIGSIGAQDIESFDANKKVSDYRYTFEPFFARSNMSWIDVLEVFGHNNTNLVPVLDESNKYIGYYEVQDVMKFFNETPFLREQGGIIVVRKPAIDYSMSQVTQIVEGNNGRMLGMFISEADADMVEITVKISPGPMNEIIQTFRRYNYEIISDHQEDTYINALKERSDYLDKYLNI